MQLTTNGWLHLATYGRAYRIRKNYLKGLVAVLCVITPFTNWLIPIAFKLIKTDLHIRRSDSSERERAFKFVNRRT